MSRPFANNTPSQPVVIATWPIGRVACEAARPMLLQGVPALDAAEAGGTAVELDPTELYVGALCNWSNYWIAELQGVELQRLVELYAGTSQIGFIGRMYADGAPVLAESFVRVKLG